MITKHTAIGLITILPDGQVQIREDTVLVEDGQELSRTYHRRVLEPAATRDTADARLAAVLEAVWTPAVVAAFARIKAEAAAHPLGVSHG